MRAAGTNRNRRPLFLSGYSRVMSRRMSCRAVVSHSSVFLFLFLPYLADDRHALYSGIPTRKPKSAISNKSDFRHKISVHMRMRRNKLGNMNGWLSPKSRFFRRRQKNGPVQRWPNRAVINCRRGSAPYLPPSTLFQYLSNAFCASLFASPSASSASTPSISIRSQAVLSAS